jgi:acyl-CoA reductase-like NAD-dependent aldehyde dehydrogenase
VRLVELLQQAGVSDGVVNVVNGEGNQRAPRSRAIR